MTLRNVEQGIEAIKAGNAEEGARLLRFGLRSPEVVGPMRAVALLWLASVTPDNAAKGKIYDEALAAAPNDPSVRQHVEAFRAAQLMPPPPGSTPTAPMAPTVAPTRQTSEVPAQFVNSPPPTSVPDMTPTNPMPAINVQQQAAPAPNPFAPAAPPQPGIIAPTANIPPGGPINSPFAPVAPKTGPLRPSVQPAPSLYHMAAVIGGPNGTGTAFFVAREGLLATTRYVVGGLDHVTIELQAGRQLQGFVVRSFPAADLAFIYVDHIASDLIPITPVPTLPDDAPLTVVSYNGSVTAGKRRATNRVIPPHWFPTDISRMPDAGGAPILDQHHYLVGMMTRSAASTSEFFYGLHINAIRNYMEMFRQEMLDGGRTYCFHCGSTSRAVASGGYYCEVCGGVTPRAENIVRFPLPQLQPFYYEHSRVSCRHCNATVGFHKNACLRCGRTPTG